MLRTVELSSLAGAMAPIPSWTPDAIVEEYLLAMRPPQVSEGVNAANQVEPERVAAQIFDVLTQREYCYLSKSRAAQYRANALAVFGNAIAGQKPVHIFFDLGGGYHASLRPGFRPLDFSVGLAEWFVLGQITRFMREVGSVYTPGARFSIVIDNLCAHAVNDVPVAETERYCASLRQLIRTMRLDGRIDLLVESERIDHSDYAAAMRRAPAGVSIELSPKQLDNVQRFLGRPCNREEAEQRSQRYAAASFATESLIAPFITGLRMTQRASNTTLCFRPFPGADCRIQAGQVVLRIGGNAKPRPMLLTSANLDEFELQQVAMAHVVPLDAPTITVACPRLI